MAVNIEIKAKVEDRNKLRRLLEATTDRSTDEIPQEDIFFHIPKGRLKLRCLAPDRGELIYYEREDALGPKQSNYLIFPCSDPDSLKNLLTAALGIRGIVRKRRLLYKIGDTRVHLDDVQSLGCFVELEVVMHENETAEEGKAVANGIMQKLGIDRADLISKAYIDLLEETMTSSVP